MPPAGQVVALQAALADAGREQQPVGRRRVAVGLQQLAADHEHVGQVADAGIGPGRAPQRQRRHQRRQPAELRGRRLAVGGGVVAERRAVAGEVDAPGPERVGPAVAQLGQGAVDVGVVDDELGRAAGGGGVDLARPSRRRSRSCCCRPGASPGSTRPR